MLTTRDDPHCPPLPVLDSLRDAFGDTDASVVGLVGLQHLLGSTVTLIDRIAGHRLDPERVLLLGKPYSTSPSVLRFLQTEREYWVHPDSARQPEGCENDRVMDERIRVVLSEMRRRRSRTLVGVSRRADTAARVLLIDDGGRAIRMLHSPEFADMTLYTTCVEQTRCGIRTLADLDLKVPVVNVAESWVKLNHESPLIAESVIAELTKQLSVMRLMGIHTGHRALIIGYGAIGKAVAAELACARYEVRVFDASPRKRGAAKRDGYQVCDELKSGLRAGGAIIGCTGLRSVEPDAYEHIRSGAVLISASSADVEFCAWNLRAMGERVGHVEATGTQGTKGDESRVGHPCFSLYRVQVGGRSFHLVNGGFPVNFTGEVDPIEPRKIQLTRGLLYLGTLQASKTVKPGMHDLDDAWQAALMTAYTKLNERQTAMRESREGRMSWEAASVCW